MGSLARAGCRQCGPEAALRTILPAQHVGQALAGSPAPNLLSCFLPGEPGRPPRQQHSLKATCRRLRPQRRRAELRHKCQWEKVALRIALCLPPLWGWGVVDPERQLLQPQDPPLSGGGEGTRASGKPPGQWRRCQRGKPLPISPSTTETDQRLWRLGKGVPVLLIKTLPVIRGRNPNETWTYSVNKQSLGVECTSQARETPLMSGQLPLLLCTRPRPCGESTRRLHPCSASHCSAIRSKTRALSQPGSPLIWGSRPVPGWPHVLPG